MAVTWTDEQKKVIDLRNRNILVSAAAGSGKTAVLVERIITMLTKDENPVSIDQLLIVTFTEAAAAEMKDRIRTAIEKKLEENPDDEHLMQQATLIHNAQITTIHSFCLSVIRDHFHAIDLDPGFRVAEEGELKLLKHDVLDDLLEEKYAEGDEGFLDFVSVYGGKNDKNLEELILKIYEYSRSYPQPDLWLEQCVETYDIENIEDFESSSCMAFIKENTGYYLQDTKEMLLAALEICQNGGPAVYIDALQDDLEILETLSQAETYGQLYSLFENIKWKRLPANRDKTIAEEKVSAVKAIREEVKNLIKSIKKQYFEQPVTAAIEDIEICRKAVQELIALVQGFAKAFEEKKRGQNLIDFSDMEQYALKILTQRDGDELKPSHIAKDYQEQFQEVMIDEYQDSNLLQEAILTSVSRIFNNKYNMFMVGDVKQSIYRFRLSRPELFMSKFDTYSLDDSEKQRIDLHKNFRSREEVLKSINHIFYQIMKKNLGGIRYDDRAALYPGADFPETENTDTEILVIETELEEGRVNAQEERELEARAIAGKIRELMTCHQVCDKATRQMRKIRYSDIAILARSIKGSADVIAEVLNQEGIPAHVGTREGYFAAQEVAILLDYLRLLNNRKQDLPMAAVLKSMLGDFLEEELALIRSEYQNIPFYQAVMEYRENGADEHVRLKLKRCLGQMDAFRKRVPYTPMHELLWQIMEETGYGDYVSAMPGGQQRKANLDMLVEKARMFESSSYKGLFHFIRYMEQLQKYDVDYGEANTEDESADTVCIMTIHKSKGLEFPVVFVAAMGKQFNMRDVKNQVVLHSVMGVGMDAIDRKTRTKSTSVIKKVIQKEEALSSLGEELRVLYVALTRAKEKLIITGTLKNLQEKMQTCEVLLGGKKTLPYEMLSTAKCYWDWIIPAVMHLSADVPIRIQTVSIEDILKEEISTEITGKMKQVMLENWDTDQVYEPKVKEQISQQFGYQYPYANSPLQKLKFSVSELKKQSYEEEMEERGEALFEEPEMIPLIPKFLQEEEILKGAARGTAYHRLLELIDFTKVYNDELLKNELDVFCESGKMTKDMAQCIWRKDILEFLQGNAGQRMSVCAANNRLWKEQPFVLGVDAREKDPQEQEGEWILVQGIIDVYFEEEDGLVLLDYKTDRVQTEEELVEKYHAQLEYYAQALERVTGKKVKEKIIYSFTLKKEISF